MKKQDVTSAAEEKTYGVDFEYDITIDGEIEVEDCQDTVFLTVSDFTALRRYINKEAKYCPSIFDNIPTAIKQKFIDKAMEDAAQMCLDNNCTLTPDSKIGIELREELPSDVFEVIVNVLKL